MQCKGCVSGSERVVLCRFTIAVQRGFITDATDLGDIMFAVDIQLPHDPFGCEDFPGKYISFKLKLIIQIFPQIIFMQGVPDRYDRSRGALSTEYGLPGYNQLH